MNNINNLYYQPLSILIAILSNIFLFYLKEDYVKSNNIFNIFYILIIFINAIFMNMILIDDNKNIYKQEQDLSIYKDIIEKCNINNQQILPQKKNDNIISQNNSINNNSLSSFHINILLIIYISIISSLLYLNINNNINLVIFKSKVDNYIPILIFWITYWLYIYIIKKIFKS
jgi:hypothetical protein